MIKIMPIGFNNVYCDTFTCTNVAEHWIGMPGDNITPDYRNVCRPCVTNMLSNLPDDYYELVIDSRAEKMMDELVKREKATTKKAPKKDDTE